MSNPSNSGDPQNSTGQLHQLPEENDQPACSGEDTQSRLDTADQDQTPLEDGHPSPAQTQPEPNLEVVSSSIPEGSPASPEEENSTDRAQETIVPAETVVPSSTTTMDSKPVKPLPVIDEFGMPLLGRTEKIIRSSTGEVLAGSNRLADTADHLPGTASQRVGAPTQYPPPRKALPARRKRRGLWISIKEGMGCILRMFILALLCGIILLIGSGSFVLYEYYNIAATLPSVADLQQKASTFETTRIFDQNNDLLYEILDPTAGRRTYTPLSKISPLMVAATIATEDKSFYSHPGFDWTAIVRAFLQNIKSGETVSGASTITQQLARNLLLSPEERSEQSYMRKVREALLAAEITRKYTKDQILELYLNEFYYGNLAYGVEAASETYFNVTADKLDLAQASFLAGLPQSPSIYDVYHNREATRFRQQQVLRLMYEASNEQGCIFVSNSPERVCVDADAAKAAYSSLENYQFNPPEVQMRYPHWVNYVRSILETQFDAQTIYRSGFSVYTTLDPVLQDEAERLVRQQIDALAESDATDGALVAIRPSTGEILAMVGSADFYNDAIAGQVNMAISATRQPGSSIKPVTYIAAFEKGWTPATLIWDVPSEFPPSGLPNDPMPPYKPVDYDGRFHGPVTVRSALANSYNVPAVKALQFVGIYDDPTTPNEDGMLAVARRLGITSLTREDYGLSLTLGGGEVSLMEMTGAYAVIANAGIRVPPVAISRILDHNGNVVYEYQPPAGEQVIRPEHAYLISSILSDNDARQPMFGADSVLHLPFPVAAKTGTSNDFRDNWTLGYTPDIAVGVWVGNADYSPMKDITGVTGAAPIWSQFMKYAIQDLKADNPTPFYKPEGIVARVICAASGTEPSQWCPNQRSEIFAADQLPLPSSQDLWSKVMFDTWTKLRASSACPDFTKEEFALNVTDPWAVGWIQNDADGKAWADEMGFTDPILFAPARECRQDDPRPVIEISAPIEGQTITISPLDITGRLDVSTDFQNFTLEYGLGDNPVEWNGLFEGSQPVSQASTIYSWDVKSLPSGLITLRITMNSIRGGYAERKFHLNLQVPTATPTITPTPTLIPTYTPAPTDTPVPTVTPVPTATPIPAITEVPIPTPTPPLGVSGH